jgi:hypothetical protein
MEALPLSIATKSAINFLNYEFLDYVTCNLTNSKSSIFLNLVCHAEEYNRFPNLQFHFCVRYINKLYSTHKSKILKKICTFCNFNVHNNNDNVFDTVIKYINMSDLFWFVCRDEYLHVLDKLHEKRYYNTITFTTCLNVSKDKEINLSHVLMSLLKKDNSTFENYNFKTIQWLFNNFNKLFNKSDVEEIVWNNKQNSLELVKLVLKTTFTNSNIVSGKNSNLNKYTSKQRTSVHIRAYTPESYKTKPVSNCVSNCVNTSANLPANNSVNMSLEIVKKERILPTRCVTQQNKIVNRLVSKITRPIVNKSKLYFTCLDYIDTKEDLKHVLENIDEVYLTNVSLMNKVLQFRTIVSFDVLTDFYIKPKYLDTYLKNTTLSFDFLLNKKQCLSTYLVDAVSFLFKEIKEEEIKEIINYKDKEIKDKEIKETSNYKDKEIKDRGNNSLKIKDKEIKNKETNNSNSFYYLSRLDQILPYLPVKKEIYESFLNIVDSVSGYKLFVPYFKNIPLFMETLISFWNNSTYLNFNLSVYNYLCYETRFSSLLNYQTIAIKIIKNSHLFDIDTSLYFITYALSNDLKKGVENTLVNAVVNGLNLSVINHLLATQELKFCTLLFNKLLEVNYGNALALFLSHPKTKGKDFVIINLDRITLSMCSCLVNISKFECLLSEYEFIPPSECFLQLIEKKNDKCLDHITYYSKLISFKNIIEFVYHHNNIRTGNFLITLYKKELDSSYVNYVNLYKLIPYFLDSELFKTQISKMLTVLINKMSSNSSEFNPSLLTVCLKKGLPKCKDQMLTFSTYFKLSKLINANDKVQNDKVHTDKVQNIKTVSTDKVHTDKVQNKDLLVLKSLLKEYSHCFLSPKHVEIDYSEMCSICLMPYSDNLIVTSCLHIFHSHCLLRMGSKFACPCCREQISLKA